jgi:predicted RNA methylase
VKFICNTVRFALSVERPSAGGPFCGNGCHIQFYVYIIRMSKELIGLNRETTDAFFTKPTLAEKLIKKVDDVYTLSTFDLIIEPSAGAGAFSNLLRKHKYPLRAYDIDPKQSYIKKQDYLDLKVKSKSNVLVIGNPPFGRQSTLARQFIQKSSEFANVIAFILPKSFKKDSFKQYFPKNFHLRYQCNIPKNSFLVGTEEYDVPCVFQIWEKRDKERKEAVEETSAYFKFVSKGQNPDFSIRRIGVYAGKLSRGISDKSENSHYFIKLFKGMSKTKFESAYNLKVSYTFDNTVGPKSISKPELIKKINRVLNGHER